MSESTTATRGLTSQYTAQVAEDLERNAKEQERIGAEIAALQEQLTALQQDHAVLVSLRQALGLAPVPAAPVPAAPAPAVTPGAPVPAPRKRSGTATNRPAKATAKPVKKAKKSEQTGKPAEKALEKAADKPATRKPAATKAPAGTSAKTADAAKPAQPTLVTLVREHLTEQSEPRSAAEIATALERLHPERAVKTTVVRNTLEALVAKDQAHRSKQGSSVFYTAVNAEADKPSEEKPV
ncbi:cell wall-associated NlpC family hydrolase [Streptomyces sp. B3I7]|uniref:hypothetical protein n=1 Tax=unclassified Streptomyces TaxID=2593676 RepID=UPI0027874B8C|nr:MULTISPECIES: hypothetical protein [unclassified Streptomyces]MDQ0785132.1 cell wall-associated NlpC family hydrolase [Streptomyces sp. B3I8]MDQ0815244.1 cell wall-associated NlpC family hydrolase [Streptomyces sp. B3I7]